ncbi:potassium transporter KefB [Synechococcus sp. BSA11S]|uniref:monovalent cation:proton antiporter family protein n=1 Tax=Synechococcus sp. BSA11S TaxID=2599077 RepID=UPI001624DD43|nr:monovalent cation:proton antiporter family protein [Synechococcus sp. BSA11S]MBC1264800.1 potassium transporter KefB [Synechococcus sp. BSA11S]
MTSLLLDIVVIFTMSAMAAVLCHRFSIPSSIGLLLAGVLAGPDLFRLVQNVHEIELLAEIGVVLLLFVIGLEISLADVARLRRHFLIGGSLQFFGTAALVGAICWGLGLSTGQGVYVGFVVALSSTAIVLRMLQERAELETPHGRTTLAILIYQDVGVVPVMLMAPLLAGVGASSGVGAIAALLGRIALVALVAWLAWRWIVPWLLERITRTRSSEAFLLGVFSLCVGIAVMTQSLGLSLALGAFLAGFILSESEYSHQAVAVMLPFRDVLMSLFFVSIGMLLDIQFMLAHPLALLLLTLAVVVIKPLVAAWSALVVGLPLRGSVLTGLALAQVGEFSLVATKAGVSTGLLGPDIFQTVLDVAVLSMMLTPALVASGPRLAAWLATTPLRRLERRSLAPGTSGTSTALNGHILIVGFGVTGSNLARTARRCNIPYAVLDVNAAIVRDAFHAGEPIHYGDASQEPILSLVNADQARAIVVVIDDPAGARRIVELARRFAPDAYILVRSRYLREVETLLALGADEVIADELEVSIEVFSRVLSRMLVPREEIQRLIGDVRGDWRQRARGLPPEPTAVSDLRVAVPHLTTHSLRLAERSPLVGHTIASCGLRADHNVTILAITRAGEPLAHPHGHTPLLAGDLLFVIGPDHWNPATVLDPGRLST